MLKFLRKVGRTVKQISNRLRYPKPSPTFKRFGSEFGGWWLETAGLGPHSNIISAGVGEDVTFDLALIEQFGCSILALDPTPKAVAYAATLSHIADFQFQPYGLAAEDGEITLAPPQNPNYASYWLISQHTSTETFRFPVKSLQTVMGELGWSVIDLLKLDIEGSEYDVIDNLVTAKIPVRQLCVEFHDTLAVQLGHSTARSIGRLENYGLKLVFVEYDNHTFLVK